MTGWIVAGLFVLTVATPLAGRGTEESRMFSILDFGAVEGTKVTESIDAALAACERSGGGAVLVPKGTWLTGAVRLRSNCELRLADYATLEFSDDPTDYPDVMTTWEGVEQRRISPLILAANVTNVSITGAGVLSARLQGWSRRYQRKESRPHFIQFNRCRDVRLKDFRICGSPAWMIHLYQSSGCRLEGLDCCAVGRNNDGVDVEMSRDVVIENCRFDQGDDGIALKSGKDAEGRRIGIPTENVTVRSCWFGHCHGMLSIGSELSGGIRNVKFSNCRVEFCGAMVRIKTTSTRGGFVEDVVVRNCRGKKMHRIFDIMADYANNPGDPSQGVFHTPIRSVLIDGIQAEECEFAYRLHCDKDCPPTDVVVRNVRIGKRQHEADEIFDFPDVKNLEGVIVK